MTDRERTQEGGTSTAGMQEATGHVRKLKHLEDWDTEDLVKQAEGVAKELVTQDPANGMSTSQIRNFLDEVNVIWGEVERNPDKRDPDKFDRSRVILLKPLLAYSAGRMRDNDPKKRLLKDFHELFSEAADRVYKVEDFEKYKDFTRAVVAYHRYHGGKN